MKQSKIRCPECDSMAVYFEYSNWRCCSCRMTFERGNNGENTKAADTGGDAVQFGREDWETNRSIRGTDSPSIGSVR